MNGIKAFAVIGIIGFLVDASVLKFFLLWITNDPILGRAVSFPVAATITWLLNRKYTFFYEKKTRSLYMEYLHYILVNSLGLGINIFVFIFVMFYSNEAKQNPLAVLGIASLIAMFFNYFGSKYWVFENSFSGK